MGKLSGKKLILLGDETISSQAMEGVFACSGAEVAYAHTECGS